MAKSSQSGDREMARADKRANERFHARSSRATEMFSIVRERRREETRVEKKKRVRRGGREL